MAFLRPLPALNLHEPEQQKLLTLVERTLNINRLVLK